MIRAILLDAAGTLIEPAEPVAEVYTRHFAAAGSSVETARVRDAFRAAFVGAGFPDYAAHGDGDVAEQAWWRQVVAATAREAGVVLAGEAFDRCFAGLFDHYASGSAWSVFPEVRGQLDRWRAEGFSLAVVSNFDRRLHRILAELGLAELFNTVVCSADARGWKPQPAIFQQTLDRLSVGPQAAVHIGDCPAADGQGAADLGLESFVLHRPETTLVEAAQWLGDRFCLK